MELNEVKFYVDCNNVNSTFGYEGLTYLINSLYAVNSWYMNQNKESTLSVYMYFDDDKPNDNFNKDKLIYTIQNLQEKISNLKKKGCNIEFGFAGSYKKDAADIRIMTEILSKYNKDTTYVIISTDKSLCCTFIEITGNIPYHNIIGIDKPERIKINRDNIVVNIFPGYDYKCCNLTFDNVKKIDDHYNQDHINEIQCQHCLQPVTSHNGPECIGKDSRTVWRRNQ